jgi:hypothetical protein
MRVKVTLDLDRLLEEAKITQAEYDKLAALAAHGTGVLAFNILIGFGVVAVGGAALALLPLPTTAITLGLIVGGGGIALTQMRLEQWQLLANICVLVGALLLAGGIVKSGEGSVSAFLLVAVLFAAAGVFVRSALLTVLAVLALSSCVGARTGYLHATYFLGIQEPALTVVSFTAFAVATYRIALRLTADYQSLAVAASRTSVLLVNFGFWIGSLWGDRTRDGAILIADWIFAVLWALALIVAGAWAWRHHRRWLLNLVAVFAGIHFYTQWFERLGASAASVLIAGLVALGLAIALRAANARLGTDAATT